MKSIIPLFFYLIALLVMGYRLPREAFEWHLVLYGIAFGSYLWLIKKGNFNIFFGFLAAMALRLTLLFSWPVLSDDFYRFIFDGHLLHHGINPYLYLPEKALLVSEISLNPFWENLLDKMNSALYYSVYPPLHQLFFWIASLVGENLFGNVLVLRLLLLVFDGVNILLIYRLTQQWKVPVTRVWWYAFNPLVILELTGNLHFEGMVLTGLLFSLYYFGKAKPFLTALTWSWAVGVKLSPVITGPAWLSAWIGKNRKKFILFSALSIFAFVFPLKNGLDNFYQSFRLYQSNFEFNASLYYLIRWAWQGLVGYNPIVYLGPLLNALALVAIVWVGLYSPSKDPKTISEKWVWIYFIFLICQTTVHPWYLIPGFGISVLTQNRIFFFWTGLVFLSYGAYAHPDFQEYYGLLWVEYGLLMVGLASIFNKKKVLASST